MKIRTIKHGKPTQNYFMIALPRGWEEIYPCETPGAQMLLSNPQTNEQTKVEIIDLYVYKFDAIPDSIALLTYSIPAAKLKTALSKKYKLNNDSLIEFLILKELKA